MAAANDEFPRGWMMSTGLVGAGSGVTITAPAMAGVAHVLTDIQSWLLGGTSVASTSVRINGVGYLLHAVTGQNNQIDLETWSGKFVGAVGAALIIDWATVVPALCDGYLTARGYEI